MEGRPVVAGRTGWLQDNGIADLSVLRAFDPFVKDGEVSFPSAAWEIKALNPL